VDAQGTRPAKAVDIVIDRANRDWTNLRCGALRRVALRVRG